MEMEFMKYKTIAFFLVLTLLSWAQTATQNPAPAPDQQKSDQANAGCPCCDATAQSKDHHGCCMHDASAKKTDGNMDCCSGKNATCCGKDAKSCKKGDKASASCCGSDKDHNKACCHAGDETKTTAMNCCSAECPMHHSHHGDQKQ